MNNLTALAVHRAIMRVHHAHLDLRDRPDSLPAARAYERAVRDAHELVEQLAPDGRSRAEQNLAAATRHPLTAAPASTTGPPPEQTVPARSTRRRATA